MGTRGEQHSGAEHGEAPDERAAVRTGPGGWQLVHRGGRSSGHRNLLAGPTDDDRAVVTRRPNAVQIVRVPLRRSLSEVVVGRSCWIGVRRAAATSTRTLVRRNRPVAVVPTARAAPEVAATSGSSIGAVDDGRRVATLVVHAPQPGPVTPGQLRRPDAFGCASGRIGDATSTVPRSTFIRAWPFMPWRRRPWP
ncbi:MAG: hypothetical protein RL219_2248, partial [Actinomycetota bacterium]